ncbi:MAG: GNAT family N-acetyltransferase [Salinibacter sp.]
MTSPDTEAVRTLWADRFGGDPATRQKWIDAILDSDHSATALVAVSSGDGAVVGFGIFEIGGRDYTRSYLGLVPLDLHVPLVDRNGLFHMCCVRADWEGRGTGSALYRRRLQLLADREISRAFGISWHRPHTVDSRVLFEKHGFTALATVERYYARTSPRLRCPDCEGECTCTATLYARRIEDT